MTQEQRDELKRLEAAATPGPWLSDGDDVDEDADSPYVFTRIDPALVGGNTKAVHVLFEADWGTKEDAALIVAARNAVPDLVAENQRMRDLLTKAHMVISDTRFERGDTNKQIESFLAEKK